MAAARESVVPASVGGPLPESPSKTSDVAEAAPSVSPAMNHYLTDRDLYAAYLALRLSRKGGDLFASQAILDDCFMDTRAKGRSRSIVAGEQLVVYEGGSLENDRAFVHGDAAWQRVPRKVDATRDQVDAATELLARCERFATMSPNEYKGLRDELTARRRIASDVFGLAEAVGAGRTPPSPDTLRTVLASRDPQAIERITRRLEERWQSTQAKAVSEDDLNASSRAFDLITCDLGMDCGADSKYALDNCITTADTCRLGFRSQVLEGETPAQRQTIEGLRSVYLQAILSGDYSVWGL